MKQARATTVITAVSLMVLTILLLLHFFNNFAGLRLVHGVPVANGVEVIKDDTRQQPRRTRHLLHLETQTSSQAAKAYYSEEMPSRGWQLEQEDESSLVFTRADKRIRINFHPEQHRLLIVVNIISGIPQ